MNYKAMVLLEDLIEHFSPDQNYKIYFTLDFHDKCTGEFRKRKEHLAKGDYVDIDSEQLLNDFQSYLNDHEGSREQMIKLFAHLQVTTEGKREKLANYLLATMASFLEDEKNHLDAYLIGYDGPEIIYNFRTPKEHLEELALNGRKVKLLTLYDFNQIEMA